MKAMDMDQIVDQAFNDVMDRVERIVKVEREAAYRRALARVGVMKGSVDILVEKDREWLDASC